MSAELFVAPPTALERVLLAPGVNATLEREPEVLIGNIRVKKRARGSVQSVVGNSIVEIHVADEQGRPITQLNKPLQLTANIKDLPLPPGAKVSDLTWALWDVATEKWIPVSTTYDATTGDLVGSTLHLSIFAVIAVQPEAVDINPDFRYYPATDKFLAFGFKKYFDANGGVDRFGLPVTNEFRRFGLTVQYFEKARFEYHPEFAGTPFEVLLGLVGDEVLTLRNAHQPKAPAPTAPLPATVRYFSETGHYVAFGFLEYFTRTGGITRWGYPVSEEVFDANLGRTVQYFQRGRLEWDAKAGKVVEGEDLTKEIILSGDFQR